MQALKEGPDSKCLLSCIMPVRHDPNCQHGILGESSGIVE